MVTSRGLVLVSSCIVVSLVGAFVEDFWVRLGAVSRCAVVLCRSVVDALVGSTEWAMVAGVWGSAVVELLVVSFKVEVSDRGALVVETEAVKVSSSVRSDLAVTVAGVVVGNTSVISSGTSVRESSVLLLTVGGAVVKTKSVISSVPLDCAPSVLPWFKVLKLCTSVEASVDT